MSCKKPLYAAHVRTKDSLLLFGLCLCVNAFVYQFYASGVLSDTAQYLSYSQRILEKGALFVETHYFWYLGYVLFIAAAKILWNDNQMVVLLQVFFHGIGVVALYHSSVYLFRDRLSAWGTALLLMLWPDVLFWNFMVMTESFCVSFTCIVILLLVLHTKKQFSLLWLAPAMLMLFFIRPTGVAVLIAFALMLASTYQRLLFRYRNILLVTGTALFACFYVLLNEMLDTFVLVENYATGEIVYRATSLPDHYPGKDMILLKVPHDLLIPAIGQKPIPRLMLFILHNPLYFARLSGAKLFYFLSHTKPYYSWKHNLMLLITLLPMYFATIRTIMRESFSSHLKVFLVAFFIVHGIIILFTIEDWDGRFLMPLLPFVFLLGGRGAAILCYDWYGKLKAFSALQKLR